MKKILKHLTVTAATLALLAVTAFATDYGASTSVLSDHNFWFNDTTTSVDLRNENHELGQATRPIKKIYVTDLTTGSLTSTGAITAASFSGATATFTTATITNATITNLSSNTNVAANEVAFSNGNIIVGDSGMTYNSGTDALTVGTLTATGANINGTITATTFSGATVISSGATIVTADIITCNSTTSNTNALFATGASVANLQSGSVVLAGASGELYTSTNFMASATGITLANDFPLKALSASGTLMEVGRVTTDNNYRMGMSLEVAGGRTMPLGPQVDMTKNCVGAAADSVQTYVPLQTSGQQIANYYYRCDGANSAKDVTWHVKQRIAYEPSTTTHLVTGSTITVTNELMRYTGSGATLSTTPTIADAVLDNTCVTIEGASVGTFTLQDEDNLGSSGLALAGDVDATLGLHDSIHLCYNLAADLWIERWRALNIDD